MSTPESETHKSIQSTIGSSGVAALTEPNDDTRRKAKSEEEREAFPVVARVVDDGLDDVGTDHGGCPVRQPKQSKELHPKSLAKYSGRSNELRTMLSNPGGVSSAIMV